MGPWQVARKVLLVVSLISVILSGCANGRNTSPAVSMTGLTAPTHKWQVFGQITAIGDFSRLSSIRLRTPLVFEPGFAVSNEILIDGGGPPIRDATTHVISSIGVDGDGRELWSDEGCVIWIYGPRHMLPGVKVGSRVLIVSRYGNLNRRDYGCAQTQNDTLEATVVVADVLE
jgi:hypothetical protein